MIMYSFYPPLIFYIYNMISIFVIIILFYYHIFKKYLFQGINLEKLAKFIDFHSIQYYSVFILHSIIWDFFNTRFFDIFQYSPKKVPKVSPIIQYSIQRTEKIGILLGLLDFAFKDYFFKKNKKKRCYVSILGLFLVIVFFYKIIFLIIVLLS